MSSSPHTETQSSPHLWKERFRNRNPVRHDTHAAPNRVSVTNEKQNEDSAESLHHTARFDKEGTYRPDDRALHVGPHAPGDEERADPASVHCKPKVVAPSDRPRAQRTR